MTKDDNGKPEEINMLMANGRAKNVKEPFFYDKAKGTVLGRNLKAWGQLIGFYIILYTCLAAFWIGCLAVFLKTIDPNIPRYYGKGTIIGVNPGVGFQPLLPHDPESTLIQFNPASPETYAPYVKTLDDYLGKYSNTNNTRICTGSETNSDIIEGGKVVANNSLACRFSLDYFAKKGCSADTKYGFAEGKPCIILSLNRLIGWKPQDFDAAEVPIEVKDRYKQGSIAFRCQGIGPSDKDHIGNIEYIPELGIDGRFYPYAVMSNYHQPIAMAKFTNLPVNRVVIVECRAFAKNIEQDIVTRLGMVTFEFFRVGNNNSSSNSG